MYKEFWRLFLSEPKDARRVAGICVVTVVASLLEGLNIGLLVPLLETLNSSGDDSGHWVSNAISSLFGAIGLSYNLETILGALGVLVLLLAGMKYLRMLLVFKARAAFVVSVRTKTMENLLKSDVSYFHHEKLGTLTSTVTTQAEETGNIFVHITDFIAGAGLASAYLIAAVLISPTLTGIAFSLILVVSIAMQFFIRKGEALGTELVQKQYRLHETTVESLSGIRMIKSFMLEKVRGLQFDKSANDVADSTYKVNRNHSRLTVIQEAALFALVAGIVYLGVKVFSMEIAVIVTMLFLLYRLSPRITGLNSSRHALAATMPALRAIQATIDETADTKVVSGNTPFQGLKQGIELKDVSFAYNDGANVISNANFVIQSGQVTALAGASGAGKSTLIDLVQRFYDPIAGSILVDGIDLRDLRLDDWRRSIGIVSQDIFLFNDTVINNIELGSPGATQEDIKEAAKQAHAHEFIEALPQGYDTMVGDRGLNLSGGQRQRLALARAILKKPSILILDEATSALDSETEELVRNYIYGNRGNCTVLIVAHRMATIQDADKIIVLEDGSISQEGAWKDLLAQDHGILADYIRLQSGRESISSQ